MATAVITTIDAIDASLSEIACLPVATLSGDELAHGLRVLARLRAKAAAIELRLAHQAGLIGVGSDVGAADVKAWWANETHQTKRDTHRRVAVAKALETQRETTRDAMSRGEVAEDQATVIVRALDALPADLESGVVERAEKELVRLAEHHDATDLTRLGKRILDVVAPEVADEQERRILEREEDVAQGCRFTMSDDGHGRCYGQFVIDSARGAMLRKSLLAFSAPRRHHEAKLKPGPGRMGRAFCEYIERYPSDRLPDAGGVNAAIVVTMTLDDLRGDTNQPVTLDTGHLITARQARRLACEAGIIPIVLDGASKPLDVGRTKRFHSRSQRIAIANRDKTCTADGCDYPPSLCHVHHDIPYSQGGHTNVTTGRLLCPKHHRTAHHPKYQMKTINNGTRRLCPLLRRRARRHDFPVRRAARARSGCPRDR